MFERFTDRARKVMSLANVEAQRFNHEHIGTEHILLGIVKEGGGIARAIFEKLDVDPRKIRLEVEKLIKSGPELVNVGKMPQSPGAKRAIELAIERAIILGHNYVGTEHLLLGLIEERDGVAAKVLVSLSITLDTATEKAKEILADHIPSEETTRAEADSISRMVKKLTPEMLSVVISLATLELVQRCRAFPINAAQWIVQNQPK